MKMNKVLMVGSLASTLILSSFSSVFAQPEVNSTASHADIFIDSSVQGKDRNVLLNFMVDLEPNARENVVYEDANGKLYANKPELLEKVFKYKKTSDNIIETPDGKEGYALPVDNLPTQIVLHNEQSKQDYNKTSVSNSVYKDSSCAATSKSQGEIGTQATQHPCTGSTGPYRRVTSNANYSWQSHYVYLPGGSEIRDNNNKASSSYNGDAGYVYVGGQGANGGGVDAGLIHSTLYDNWGMLISVDSDPIGYSHRFKSKQNVNMKFSIPSTNNIALTVSGIDYTTNQNTTITIGRQAPGFVPGGGNILKRLTTIGQKPQNFHSGSYLHNAHWYNSLIGNSSMNYHTWSAADTNASGTCSFTTDVVRVNYINAGEEIDNIDI
ncbi:MULTISPECIES: hypothetical protein [Paenibacillus]|uniref:hypothetical protein n=1 Tax=Paenibacillus TaxID=44249 RepID=UPI0002EA01C0|nr:MULTISPECIES: hypothetical protein [Paenibacillus]KKD55090.1 hypothetical protein C400_09325 [Paenibacillus sp. ICGEB2008]MBE3646689.1 hypothetical protein [Paenibacillus polymyxa]